MLDPTASPRAFTTALAGRGGLLPLDLRRLTYEANGKRVIDNVDLALQQPGITVIMGPKARARACCSGSCMG